MALDTFTNVKLTAAELRSDLDRLLDQVLVTGRAIEVDRPGGTLVITPAGVSSRLGRLPRRDEAINGDPEDLVSIDWSAFCSQPN